ncbi:MAG TPA: MASE1 domain-containing protein, partial [Anaerolineaceae bacterium]|nr:MASE1 domain-containing protein [Anaerolineaceae bacterium]
MVEKPFLRRFDFPQFKLHRFLRWLLVIVLYLITFSALDNLTHTIEIFPGVVAWYPPDGLSLAFLLTFGVGFAPVFAIASLISSLIIFRFSISFTQVLVWAVILSSVYGINAFVLRRKIRIDPQLRNLRDILWLILSSAIVSTVLALISVSVLVNYKEIPASQFFYAFAQWWIGEMIGVLVFAPFFLIHVMPRVKRFIDVGWTKSIPLFSLQRPSLLVIGQIISIPLVLYLAFGIPALRGIQPIYLIAAPIIWIALTKGLSGASIAIAALNFGTIIAIWLFKFDTSRLGELQFLMFGIYISTLLTGAIVTKQKKTEEEIRQREIHNRALIENAPDAITLVGVDGLLKYQSPSTQRIFGYTPKEYDGSNPAELTHPEDLSALLDILADLSQNPGKVVTTEYRF